ncbi:uncharacterized protein RVIR1_08970 [Candidatus Rickettsiella viridis]|uniref:YCII-related domain-containing protein n=1 Tax=Candidatus Rickettsiella viridis TaxID=676208 RepID=A0A2Z5UV56_9COXI|nr:YciI family protein [Candidatus Rickettsiella viridis]BBB15378.1 uncharacterized protein RVIR1_08970 [Candidatus Rickettsiella viridis]
MFLVLITYKKPIEEIDRYLLEHRKFLDIGYKNNYFVVSGPRNPRTGGVILSQLNNRNQLENFLKDDPFFIHGIASYEVIEFVPVKCHLDFSSFIDKHE